MSFEGPLVRLSSSGSISSPLRKKSILALANTKDSAGTQLNDDDAERRERRRQSMAPEAISAPPAPIEDSHRRKSLGLGACSGLSAAQLAEHYANCIKLSTENKITVKNAFSLQLIDYMSMMLKRHDKHMEDFQVASCTLDASTKIYSFRVDAVHSDVVQMATTMGRTEAARKKKSSAEGENEADGADLGDDGDNVPQESQALKKLKKKRRHKSSITDKPDSLIRKQQVFQTMNPFLVRLSANLAVSQAGECPFHHSLKYREDLDFDLKESDSNNEKEEKTYSEAQVARGCAPLPPFPDVSDQEICPSFREFTLVGWKPENDPRPTPKEALPSLPPFNLDDDHAFDMNQTPEPIPDFDSGGVPVPFDDGMDSDAEEFYAAPEAACRAAAKLARQPAHVVDLRQHLSTVPLEYSYFQQSMVSLWAGPTHWKLKPVKKDKAKDIAFQKEAKKRGKKELVLNFENTAELQKCFGCAMKLNRKTIQGWSSSRVTMPFDIHYDGNRISRLFLRESITVKFSDKSTPPEVDDGVGDYPYDNPTDQENFCPNLPTEDDIDDDNGADIGDGMTHDDDDVYQSQDVHTEIEAQDQEQGAFTGDNLIAPPNKVARMYIPYQMRAKKMDMKKLKVAMWEVLTDAPDSDKVRSQPSSSTGKENQIDSNLQDEADEMEKQKIKRAIHFKELYEVLPSRVGPKMAENLSCALAFVGLLHLANEKCLDIKGTEDYSNLIIKQG